MCYSIMDKNRRDKAHYLHMGPILQTWFNFNTSMDKY